MRKVTHADVQRIRHVLAGLAFPAEKWQLIMHAEDYGADSATRADLWGLPAGTYDGIAAVLVALGPASGPPQPGYRSAPPSQAEGKDQPGA